MVTLPIAAARPRQRRRTFLVVVCPVRQSQEGEVLPLLRQQVAVVALIGQQRRVGELHLRAQRERGKSPSSVSCSFNLLPALTSHHIPPWRTTNNTQIWFYLQTQHPSIEAAAQSVSLTFQILSSQLNTFRFWTLRHQLPRCDSACFQIIWRSDDNNNNNNHCLQLHSHLPLFSVTFTKVSHSHCCSDS